MTARIGGEKGGGPEEEENCSNFGVLALSLPRHLPTLVVRNILVVQLAKSSRAIHGGAYFSAVFG